MDDGAALEEKKKIAGAILSFPKPKFKTENKQKKDIEKLLKIELNIHQQIPSLASYKLFLNFAKSIVCVNDHAERAIGMMQQFFQSYRDEEEKQNRLIAMDKVRSIFKASGSESLLTKKQNNKVISKKRIAKGLLSLSLKNQKIA